jgi:hypothetical protein
MKNVLAVYTRPHDPKRPVVCFDEKSKKLVGKVCKPIAARPGEVERCDYEYVRNGTANLFMMVEPLGGWRQVNVTTRRTKVDFAMQRQEQVDVHYPEAEKITLVMDNLNTYRMSCLYESFMPIEARRAMAWRCHDRRSLQNFLGYPITEPTPDPSSLTVIRQRLPLDIHEQVFAKVLALAPEKKLLKGKTVAVDSTFLEADAAMKSIVGGDNGDDWKAYLRKPALETGKETGTITQ